MWCAGARVRLASVDGGSVLVPGAEPPRQLVPGRLEAAPGRAGDTGVMLVCGEVDNNIYLVDNEAGDGGDLDRYSRHI